jgi:hypothetical protein
MLSASLVSAFTASKSLRPSASPMAASTRSIWGGGLIPVPSRRGPASSYGKAIPAEEEAVLRERNKLDGVDAAEMERNRRISTIQGNRNQFVEHANLADRIKDF